MERTLEALRSFAALLEGKGVERVFAVGTGVLCKARNRSAFVRAVGEQTGFSLRILSGPEEARAMAKGVLGSLKDRTTPRLIADVGGGSTEMIWMEGKSPRKIVSLDLGAVELTERFLFDDPPDPAEMEALNQFVKASLLEVKQKVRVRVWHKLHFKRLAVPGAVVCVEFLKEDGTPRYKRPLWLFWTGPQEVRPHGLCRMYLWRFAIEHLFRFLKQHLGLNSHRSCNFESLQRWMWIVALAYWQLLLLRDTVQSNRPAWHPRKKDGQVKPLTPAQVQRSAQTFLLLSGSPAPNTRPAGKGLGRQNGYRPAPRKRYEIVFETKKTQTLTKNC